MRLVEELVASLERVKIYTASCEDVHRRCQWLLTTLEDNSVDMEPEEALQATRLLECMLLNIRTRLDEWGRLTLLESFIRRAEIQLALRAMGQDLKILASQLQLVPGPGLHASSAEIAHLDIQDSLEMKGILRYIAGRSEELKTLTQTSFTPSDCQNLAKALQTDICDPDGPQEDHGKLSDALWKLVTWTNMPLPLADLTTEVRTGAEQFPIWQSDFTEVFTGKWNGHSVVLSSVKVLHESKMGRKAYEEGIEVWRNLRHNHIQTVWGSIRLDGDLYTVSPCMKHWKLDEYLETDPPVDRFNLVMNLAAGLEFLHRQTPPILVGVLTPADTHISEKGKVCIANYGVFPIILQLVHDGILPCTPTNVRFFASELLAADRAEITTQSDVYSFAMFCFQILTDVQAFQNVPEEELVTFICEGNHPERPQTDVSLRWLFDELWELLKWCWSKDPAHRPDMTTVVATLRTLHRARKDGSTSVTITRSRMASQRQESRKSSLKHEIDGRVQEPYIRCTPSGGIISGTLSGLVARLLSDTAGISSDPIGNTFFYMFRAFTSPEVLLDTLEAQYSENYSQAVSVEGRIATCFDVLNFLNAWLLHDRSYAPSKMLTEKMKNLLSSFDSSFNSPPTLVERVDSFLQLVDEWTRQSGVSMTSASSHIPGSLPNHQFDLGGISPRSLARTLAHMQSELFYNILPTDFVQWSQNIPHRSGRNNISIFISRHNQIGHLVEQTILETNDLRRRAETIEFFIHTASECLALGNYSAAAAISDSLQGSFISRLTLTWKCISDQARNILLGIDKVFEPGRNYNAYRRSLATKEPRIPHLGIHLRDVKMLSSLASPTVSYEDHHSLIPFAKYQNLYRHIIDVVMDPEHYAVYQNDCHTDISAALDSRLQHIVTNDISTRDLERRSTNLIASERRLYRIRRIRLPFGNEKKGSIDDLRARSPTSADDGSDSDYSPSRRPLPFRIKDLSREVVKLQEHSITGGGFCDVYLGEAKVFNTVERVAMKMLRVGGAEQKIKKSFYREVETWIRVRHPFVLPFYGVSEQSGKLFMISPWAEHGNALQYLEAYPTANRRKLLWQTSDALKYLHSGTDSPQIVHGDIKAENILVSATGDAMLADFGLARLVDTIAAITTTTTTLGGSARFMAPELLLPKPGSSESDKEYTKTTRSDVWAFGCLMLQVFSGDRPFSHLSNEAQVILAIVREEKPTPRPPGHEASRRGFDEDLWVLACKCWEYDPEERPGMKIVSTQLRQTRYRLQTADII